MSRPGVALIFEGLLIIAKGIAKIWKGFGKFWQGAIVVTRGIKVFVGDLRSE
jgi:hypothetical protein